MGTISHMKKILFPATSPIHIARNQLLLEELKKNFEVHIATYGEKDMSMSDVAVDITLKFRIVLEKIKPDLVLIRADRAELLPCAMLSVYGGYKVIQLEAGDRSGTWDEKVRYSISALADYHFTTNNEAQRRMLSMGYENVFQCGSLDCEYALTVEPQNAPKKPYILVTWHPLPSEPGDALYRALEAFKDEFDIVGVRGNKDYGIESSFKEWYEPAEFINLLRGASVAVGNSSCLLKESSVLGTPCVLIGERQKNRLRPTNVQNSQYDQEEIEYFIRKQIKHGRYERDDTYYIPESSKKIASVITFL